MYRNIYGRFFFCMKRSFGVTTIPRRITLGVEKTLISTPGIDDFLSRLHDGVDQEVTCIHLQTKC
jgi:hypothetical protein